MNIFEIESLQKEYVTKVIIVKKINRINNIFRKLKLNGKKRKFNNINEFIIAHAYKSLKLIINLFTQINCWQFIYKYFFH